MVDTPFANSSSNCVEESLSTFISTWVWMLPGELLDQVQVESTCATTYTLLTFDFEVNVVVAPGASAIWGPVELTRLGVYHEPGVFVSRGPTFRSHHTMRVHVDRRHRLPAGGRWHPRPGSLPDDVTQELRVTPRLQVSRTVDRDAVEHREQPVGQRDGVVGIDLVANVVPPPSRSGGTVACETAGAYFALEELTIRSVDALSMGAGQLARSRSVHP